MPDHYQKFIDALVGNIASVVFGKNCLTALMISVFLTLATSCATYRVETFDTDPEIKYRGGTIHSLAWGTWYSPQLIAAECHGRGINDVRVHRNILYDLAGVLTLGFWMPAEIELRCRAPGVDAGEFPDNRKKP
jgi:hypothetical protein